MIALKRITAAAAALAAGVSFATAAELTEAWKASGFDLPESVSYDPGSNAYYVSNLGADPMSKDGNGFISKLSADGKVEKLKWAEGLNAPKGTEIVGGSLFVADLDELVEINLTTGAIANRTKVEGAKFLNDLAAATDGRIFIADTLGDAIFLFENGSVGEWLKDPKLHGPNGLTIDGTYLVVASVGTEGGSFEKMSPANVKKVDLVSKEITDFGTAAPIGALDGIERTGDGGVTVTDNFGGRMLLVKPGQPAEEIAKLKPGSADHEFVPNLGLLIIPQMQEGEIVAYNWKP
jgi:DNA-binding beta-propeller fold protein YncE